MKATGFGGNDCRSRQDADCSQSKSEFTHPEPPFFFANNAEKNEDVPQKSPIPAAQNSPSTVRG
jgi:hypothetical protein